MAREVKVSRHTHLQIGILQIFCNLKDTQTAEPISGLRILNEFKRRKIRFPEDRDFYEALAILERCDYLKVIGYMPDTPENDHPGAFLKWILRIEPEAEKLLKRVREFYKRLET